MATPALRNTSCTHSCCTGRVWVFHYFINYFSNSLNTLNTNLNDNKYYLCFSFSYLLWCISQIRIEILPKKISSLQIKKSICHCFEQIENGFVKPGKLLCTILVFFPPVHYCFIHVDQNALSDLPSCHNMC